MLLAGSCVVLLLACSPGPTSVASETPRSAEAPGPEYAGSFACSECHAREFAAWTGSHHDLAMQEATEATVLGDFDGARFEAGEKTAHFFRRDGAFLVETQGPDGELATFEVAWVFGFEPLQQYLVRFAGGRVQCLTIAWDTKAERWFDLYEGESFATDDPLHWTGVYQRWNGMCAECHSTHLVKGYDNDSNSYETTFEEIDVGCEACHGPGEEHIRWAAGATPGEHYAPGTMALATDLRRGAQREQMDACAPCHSRRTPLVETPAPGAPFLDGYLPELLLEGSYHADGQIQDEVYVWGSYVQSKMHARGVSCTDCHDPHSLELVIGEDALCMQCHTVEAPLDRFPTLQKKDYGARAHHFHEPDTEAARCVSCHMPSRTYMVVDPRRDHSFRIPRPDLSVAIGTPNACNDCHTDRTPQWATEAIEQWYGEDPETVDAGDHFAVTFARARRGDPESFQGLVGIAGDGEQAAIVRATALTLLEPFGELALPTLGAALGDDDALVRATAVDAMTRLRPEVRAALVPPLLSDPLRVVRIEAARVLAGVPAEMLPAPARAPLEAALEEFRAAQEYSGDMPWSHLNLARMQEDLGRPDAAEAAYRRSIARDPYFLPARFNLANLLNAAGRNGEAEGILREGIERAPEEGELYYSLGLLLAEETRLQDAAKALEQAARLMPDRARIHYNLGLTLQHLERRQEATTALLRAQELEPENPEFVHALAILFLQSGDLERARFFALELVRLVPEAPGPRQLLEELDARTGTESSRR